MSVASQSTPSAASPAGADEDSEGSLLAESASEFEGPSPLQLSPAERLVLLRAIQDPAAARAAWRWLLEQRPERELVAPLAGELVRIASLGCEEGAQETLQRAQALIPQSALREDLHRQIGRCIKLRALLSGPAFDFMMVLQTALQPVSQR